MGGEGGESLGGGGEEGECLGGGGKGCEGRGIPRRRIEGLRRWWGGKGMPRGDRKGDEVG